MSTSVWSVLRGRTGLLDLDEDLIVKDCRMRPAYISIVMCDMCDQCELSGIGLSSNTVSSIPRRTKDGLSDMVSS